jgi:hypothetical protein
MIVVFVDMAKLAGYDLRAILSTNANFQAVSVGKAINAGGIRTHLAVCLDLRFSSHFEWSLTLHLQGNAHIRQGEKAVADKS